MAHDLLNYLSLWLSYFVAGKRHQQGGSPLYPKILLIRASEVGIWLVGQLHCEHVGWTLDACSDRVHVCWALVEVLALLALLLGF